MVQAKKQVIRAAALSYAVVFSLLIGLICSGVILIAATQKKIEILNTNKEHILFDSYTAVRYASRVLNVGDSTSLIHSSGDTSFLLHKPWGAFSMICASTHKFPLEKKRTALTGFKQLQKLPCFYLPGNNEGLKITGETRLEGKVIVPNKSVERAYIAGKSYVFSELVFGAIEAADLGLPPLKKEWQNLQPNDWVRNTPSLPYLHKDSSYSFLRPTTYYQQIQPIFIHSRLRGNVIIHSFDSIYVHAEAELQNVLLIAPVIRFQKGFRGCVQILANERVTCEENVRLDYPSVLVLNELTLRNRQTIRSVFIGEQAQVLGGILITSQEYDYAKAPFLELREKSVVGGMIYNVGETEAKGIVIGSLYTGKLSVRAGGGSYGNHLVDALISQKRLPEYFLLPGWLESQQKKGLSVITWL